MAEPRRSVTPIRLVSPARSRAVCSWGIAMRLGVVVPLANEEATLDDFLGRVLAQLGHEDGVFCVVDNASRDRTRELVEANARRDPRVSLVWAPHNRCVVDAYFSGYHAA